MVIRGAGNRSEILGFFVEKWTVTLTCVSTKAVRSGRYNYGNNTEIWSTLL